MAVLGLILLAAAGVLTAAVVTSNTDTLAVDLWGVSVSNVTLGVVFVAGMITTVLAVVGLGLLMGGLRRGRRLRKERRTLRRENEQLSQRVDSTPAVDESAARHDDRTYADQSHTDQSHTDRTHTDPAYSDRHDDRTRVEPTPAQAGYDAPAEGATESSTRRRFLGRNDRTHTESVPRDN